MQIKSDTAVKSTDHPVAIPWLSLDENPVRDDSFIKRIPRLCRVNKPIFIVLQPILKDEISLLITAVTLVRISPLDIGINLAPDVILE